jgi:hypothetical protein
LIFLWNREGAKGAKEEKKEGRRKKEESFNCPMPNALFCQCPMPHQ